MPRGLRISDKGLRKNTERGGKHETMDERLEDVLPDTDGADVVLHGSRGVAGAGGKVGYGSASARFCDCD